MKRIAIAAARQSAIGSAFKYKQDYVNEAYTNAIFSASALPSVIPYTEPANTQNILNGYDALMLIGGEDIDPAIYGEETRYAINRDADLDRFHIALVHAAMRLEIPVLGICRGFQIINVTLGGSLYQDLKKERPDSKVDHLRLDIPYSPAHTVELKPYSFLHQAFRREILDVNSLHHQGIKTLGFGLKATAVASDGLIEAFESDKMLGVQWHPEAQLDQMKSLFTSFIEEYMT